MLKLLVIMKVLGILIKKIMENFKLPTTTILGIISIAELITTSDLTVSFTLWIAYGIYKLLTY